MPIQFEAQRLTDSTDSTDSAAHRLMQTVSAERAQMRLSPPQTKAELANDSLDFGRAAELYGTNQISEETSTKERLEDILTTQSPSLRASIQANMQAFENRMNGNPNRAEIIESTYESVLQVINLNSTVKPDSLKISVAQEMLAHAASPLNIDQGNFNTCSAAVLEGKLWYEHPDKAAQIIADNLSQGIPQRAAANSRNLSSEILQGAIINTYLAPQNLRYSLGEPDPENPTGERISPINEPNINLFPKYLPNPFLAAPLQETYARLSGEPTVSQLELITTSNDVFNKEELEDRLSRFQENNAFPLMAVVNVRSAIVIDAIGADRALGSALAGIEYHAILIEKYDPDKQQVTVRNSLDGGKPHSMSVAELSNDMRTPAYTENQIATLVARASASNAPINRADLINFLSRTQETQRQTIIASIVAAGGRDLSAYLSDEDKERLGLDR